MKSPAGKFCHRVFILEADLNRSMDAESEQIVQQLIRKEFSSRTILATTHRLATVLGFDCVVMLEHGRIAEIGDPRKLLERSESLFRRQYEGL